MMRILRWFGGLIVKGGALILLLGFIVYALSEIGPEVVTVETFAPDGTRVSTRLWIVDEDGRPWLRAGVPEAAWLHPDWLDRLETQPRVVVHRVTGVREFDAVPVREPEARERVQALMRAKYGVRDLLMSLIYGGEVPIRLDPVPADRSEGSAQLDSVPERSAAPTGLRWRARSLDPDEAKRR